MIHYLMYINTHGDITEIRLAKGVNPTDRAIDAEVGLYCVHYMSALEDVGTFHSLKAWNYSTSQWDDRTVRPNKYAVWEEGAWTWNAHSLLEDIRKERSYLLMLSDWTISSDSPLSESQQTEARNYRVALRNLPASITIADIDSVANTPWPTKPSFL